MTRVLITVFDALRPEFVRPDLMPNLYRFADGGVRYANARSTFPTETRVNQSAVTTGCMPRKHGVVANRFVADDLLPGLLVNTGDDTKLERAFTAGPVLAVPNMGQRLRAVGKTYASLSAGTPGGGRLINHSAEADGTFRLAMNRPRACAPTGVFDRIVDRIGPLPEYHLPATDWITWAVSAYLDYIEPEISPDVMLLWLCEPDESFHWKGIGSPEALETIRHVDAEFGRLIDRLGPEIQANRLQIVAMSDHGQISLTGGKLDISGAMAGDGFRVSTDSLADADYLSAIGNAGGIWVRDRDPRLVERALDWLMTQPWCGPVYTLGGARGTLCQAELWADHARAPDISVVARTQTGANAHGIEGLTLHDAPYPEGGGCHGGLSAHELHNVLVLGGGAFGRDRVIEAPGGNVDILPTVFAVLGLPVPDGLDGRVLGEAFADGSERPTAETTVLRASNDSGPVTHLQVTEVAGTRYLDRSWVEN